MMLETYEPLDVLKPVAEGIWLVDGPLVSMALGPTSLAFPTRMVVVRLGDGGLFLWSPTALSDELAAQVDALGPVRHLISPNKIHYAHIGDWQRRYPEATSWASTGVRERARSQKIDVRFDADLGDDPEPAWADDLDQLIIRGGRFLDEVVFLHRTSRTLILADLIENLEEPKIRGRFGRWLFRLAGAVDPDGKMPLDLRLTFLGRRERIRPTVQRMIAWEPERILLAHGRWYDRDGAAELRRAFRWVGIDEAQP